MRDRVPRLRRLAAWVGLGIVVSLVFELTCRVEDWVMYRMPLVSPYRSVEDLIVRDADGMHGRPNAQFQKWIMNGVGTRGPNASVVPAAGTVRVIAVGASETFGLRESPRREFPRQLEDSLNARLQGFRCANANVRFEVLNAAFAGMTLPTINQDLRNRLVRLRPAVIVAYPSPTAYLEDEVPTAARPDSFPKVGRRRAFAAIHPRALERLRDQLKEILPTAIKSWLRRRETQQARAHPSGWLFTTPPAERLAAFDLDLRRLVAAVHEIGATPVLVTHANAFVGRSTIDLDKLVSWEKFAPRATGTAIIAFDSLSRLTTLKIAADSQVVAADATPRLAAAPDTAFADYQHFGDLGAALMASVVTDGVLKTRRLAQLCASADSAGSSITTPR